MKRKTFENFEFFDESRWKDINEQKCVSEEGECEECGVQGIVTKIKGKLLCDLCTSNFIKNKNCSKKK
ncbi:MAG: hypothetical protein QXQ82_00540 [Candidatus Pacearchaeota archaeon]